MIKSYTVIHYMEDGRDIFQEWLDSLHDLKGRVAIARAEAKLLVGNLGDHKPCREGVWELRINISSGYRVYYSIAGQEIILLLCGGSKRTQQKDINKAVAYLKKYKEARKWKSDI